MDTSAEQISANVSAINVLSYSDNVSAINVLSYSDIFTALLCTFALTLAICLIDAPRQSKTSLRSCLGVPLCLYAFIFITGNIITTLIAIPLMKDQIPSTLLGFLPFFASFFGVFAFQGVLSHANISLYENNVLTIEKWIKISLDHVVEMALKKQIEIENGYALTRADLIRQLPHDKLNAYIASFNNPNIVSEIEKNACDAHADPALYKALWLSYNEPIRAEALARNIKLMKPPLLNVSP